MTTYPQCSHPMCAAPATRQYYAPDEDGFALDPWNPDNYLPRCAGHAPRNSWPLIEERGKS